MVDAEQASCIGRVPGKGSRREERCKGRLCHQARNLVPSAAACSAALRHAADYTIPRADTCEMTHFHASKRSTNAVCIAYPHGVDFASVKAQVEQASEWLRVQAPAQSPTQSTEHPERWERPGCCIKHGMQITQNHKDGRSCENAAGVSVYQLIVTKLSNREKLVVEGSRAELDELFRLYTMHRR